MRFKKNKKNKTQHNKMLWRVSFINAVLKVDFRLTNGDLLKQLRVGGNNIENDCERGC